MAAHFPALFVRRSPYWSVPRGGVVESCCWLHHLLLGERYHRCCSCCWASATTYCSCSLLEESHLLLGAKYHLPLLLLGESYLLLGESYHYLLGVCSHVLRYEKRQLELIGRRGRRWRGT